MIGIAEIAFIIVALAGLVCLIGLIVNGRRALKELNKKTEEKKWDL